MTDIELVDLIKRHNCETSLKELSKRHSALCWTIIKQYRAALESKNLRVEDVFNDRLLVIYKSAQSFKTAKKTKFSSWLGLMLRYDCLNILKRTESFVKLPDIERAAESRQANIEKLDYVKNILGALKDKRIKRIFDLRYFEGSKYKTSWKEVAQAMGLSTRSVMDLHDQGRKFLKNKLTNSNSIDII